MANNEIKEIPADILLGLSQLKHMYVLYYFLIYLIVLMCLWSEKFGFHISEQIQIVNNRSVNKIVEIIILQKN